MAALTDEDLERMAMEEILKESKRNAERAKEFGSLGWQNPGKSTNKRFLSNMLVSTLRNPLQKSRFNNERQSSDSDSSNGRKKRRHSQKDRQRKSSERYSKSYQDKREKNTSESSYRRNNVRGRYDPYSRRFSGNQQPYEDHRRKHEKGSRINHTANGRSTFQRGGSLGEEDIYHEDYMEYIQNYKKHMNYYEKMEECMQEKYMYKRSYHSEEHRSPDNEAKMEEQGKSKKLKKASKTKKKRSWSDSNEFSGSDISECEKKSKTRNHSQSPTRKKKSKHKRKGFRDNDRKTKKNRKNSVVNERSDSEDVNSPEGTESAGCRVDSEAILASEEQKGNNSELSNTTSSQEGTKSHKKQSKHKKHKHKKHKKVKESTNK